ncbi:MAG: hypothetical protein DMG11_22640 [Acidobacteria bacterium]|nr:MAG: hypothetical protein DMG11_22640 [Acidobacteriota bacterium]
MNRRMFGMLAISVAALLSSVSALAHHGRALIYDANKETTLKGTVTEFVWSNPHVQIGIEAADAKGTRRQWLLETSSTPIMATKGWSRKSLKSGDIVTVTFHPGMKGAPTGDLIKLVFADGRELK